MARTCAVLCCPRWRRLVSQIRAFCRPAGGLPPHTRFRRPTMHDRPCARGYHGVLLVRRAMVTVAMPPRIERHVRRAATSSNAVTADTDYHRLCGHRVLRTLVSQLGCCTGAIGTAFVGCETRARAHAGPVASQLALGSQSARAAIMPPVATEPQWPTVFEQKMSRAGGDLVNKSTDPPQWSNETTAGSAIAVAAAVARGADLRLYMTTQDDSNRQDGLSRSSAYEETLYFGQTYASLAEGTDRFAGLCPHHTSTSHEGKVSEQPYMSLFRYDSSGSYSHLKWWGSGETKDSTNTYPYNVYRWFVSDRFKPCFEHDADGNVVAGTLDALVTAVRNGLTIKVGVYGLSALRLGTSDAAVVESDDDTISYLPGLQPLVMYSDRASSADAARTTVQPHVAMNCDSVLLGPPHANAREFVVAMEVAFVKPSTSGEIEVFATKPGYGATPWSGYSRSIKRAAMRWLVADYA